MFISNDHANNVKCIIHVLGDLEWTLYLASYRASYFKLHSVNSAVYIGKQCFAGPYTHRPSSAYYEVLPHLRQWVCVYMVLQKTIF